MPSWNRTVRVLGAIAVLAGLMVWLGPAERTLGGGIRAVYMHVSLTGAGVIGLFVAALLGLWVLVSGSRAVARWLLPVGRVSLGLFAAGTITSVLAAWINWGGPFLREPLVLSSLVALAIGFLFHAWMTWTTRARLRGLLSLGPAVAIVRAVVGTPLLLHPGAMVLPESATAIQGTFLALTVLYLAAGARLAWQLGARPDEP